MSAPQFTPGPWSCTVPADVDYAPMVFTYDGGDPLDAGTLERGNGEAIANANLIAAAPELYGCGEFLCDRLRDLEGYEGYDGDELLRQLMGHVLPALARMEMALRKARGEDGQ